MNLECHWEGGVRFLNQLLRGGLIEKVKLSKGLKEVKEFIIWVSG